MIPWGLIVCKIWLTVVHGGLMVTDRLVKDDFCLVIYMWPQKNQRQAYVCNLDFSRPPFKLMASVQIKYSRILVIDSFVICIAILQDPLKRHSLILNTVMPAGRTIPNTFVTAYSGPRSGRAKSRRYGRKRVRTQRIGLRGRVIRASR